ncbi:hypothetical protein QJS10_CPA08g00013 [Acorus calamus]|uniref:Outer envelope protein 61 n=1 Tax=Acorus calamus TaxID=4465 RepID=A0AAV9EB17_ACOCL|nr:hypothetical protein QJS10_CPA08g00013 [Acorus calamus]
MFDAMMDPEMMRIAQEQLKRIPPQELAKIQQQMMSNPELMKLATEGMKNFRPEDLRQASEQLKHTPPEEMVKISEKISSSKPEEIAAMQAQAEAHLSYELNAAEMLKSQGNKLHSQGKFHEAAEKYLRAKNNLKDIPISKCKTLQLACCSNLMSCYLRTGQFDECIKEGSEVLALDTNNVKAFYRRGQAYKEVGNLHAAVADLSKAHGISPDDETIASVLSDVQEKLKEEGGQQEMTRGVVIEEIIDEENQSVPSEVPRNLDAERSGPQPPDGGEFSHQGQSHIQASGLDSASLQSFKDNPEALRSFQNYVSSNPESLAALGAGGMSPEMVKTASDMISNMKPEELQEMLKAASSLEGSSPFFPGATANSNSNPLGMSPDMIKTATDMIGRMSEEERQRMFKVASSLKDKNPFFPMAGTETNSRRSNGTAQSLGAMLTSMMKSMSPEMMADMSQQFGIKLSKEDAEKAQQALSSFSPDSLEKMMLWAERAQKAAHHARRTKNWLLGRPGMILAICMLIVAFILHKLGFIGN